MPSADKSIGRVYLEADVDLSRLNKGFDQMVKAITDVDGKVKSYGDKLKSSFEAAYNPTLKLGSQLEALAKQGKTAGELIAVFGDRIQKAMETVARTGAAPSAMVKNLSDQMAAMAKKTEESTEATGAGFRKFGQILTDLVAHPLRTAQSMIVKFAEALGPLGVGLLGIGTAIVAGATALYKFISAASDAYEQLENLSIMTGESINTLKALRQAADEAGFEGLDLGRSLFYINQQLAETGKAGDLQKGMDALGISVRDANGNIKDALTIIDELGGAIYNQTDPIRQASDLAAVFGVRYRELGAFAVKLQGQIRETTKAIEESGNGYSKAGAQMLKDMDAAKDSTSRYFEALKNSWVTSLGEIWSGIKGLKDNIEKLPAWFKNFIGAVTNEGQTQFAPVQIEGPGLFVGPTDPGLAARMRAIEERDKALADAGKKAAEAAKKAEEERQKQLIVTMELAVKLNDETKLYGGFVEAAAKIWQTQMKQGITDAVNKTGELGTAIDQYARSLYELNQLQARGPWAQTGGGGQTFEDFKNSLPKITQEIQTFVDSNDKAAKSVADVWRNQVSTIVTDWSRGIADILIEGGDFGKKLTDIFKETAKSILRMLIEQLFNPLKNLFSKIFSGATSNQSGGTGFLGSLGGIFGTAAGSIATGGLLGAMIPQTTSGKILGGIAGGVAGVGAYGAYMGATTAAGTFGGIQAALASIGPWGWAALGATAIGTILYKIFTKSSVEAGAMEAARDLGGIKIGESTIKSFYGGLGLSDKQSYGIRKDLLTSPLFISSVAVPAAESQGRLDALLKSLEKVTVDTRIAASGYLNFRTAVEQGIKTGNWEAFNKQWSDAFAKSQALTAIMPDFASKLAAVATTASDAADAATGLSGGMQALLDAIVSTQDAADDMYGTFLKTGEILPELAAEIQKYGGNLEVFQRYASLGGLRENLTAIGNLISGLGEILPDLDPIQKLLSGGGVDWGGLQAMGLDPSKLIGMADLVAFESRWEESVRQFQDTGRLLSGSILQQALWKFGGAAGATALERYGQGFNTITPGLLDITKSAMDAAYKTERETALDYLKGVQTTMESEIQAATDAIVTELKNILAAIQAGGVATPAEAVTSQGGTYIDMRGATVYGYEDFESRVQTAWTSAHRRGAFSYAVP